MSHEATPKAADDGRDDFDETLLTGLLDGVLTPSEEQELHLRLERDAHARRLYIELRSVRQAALDTPWDDAPVEGAGSRRNARLQRLLGIAGLAADGALLAVLIVLEPAQWPRAGLIALAVVGLIGSSALLYDVVRRGGPSRWPRW